MVTTSSVRAIPTGTTMRMGLLTLPRVSKIAEFMAVATLIWFSWLQSIQAATAAAPPEISVTAALDSTSLQEPKIVFTLVNNAQLPVEIYESDLPWGIQASLSLTVFRLYAIGTTSEVEPYYLIDDPGPGTVVVAPGATLTGHVNLTERFAGLEGPRRTSDLLVRWYYAPMNANMEVGKPSGGWVVIPRISSP
jgi:hypothetical protein